MHLQIRDIVETPRIFTDWALPVVPRECLPASLSDVLGSLSELESSLLPNSRRAIAAINKAASQTPRVEPSSVTRERRLYGRVGLAVDRAVLFLSGVDVAAESVEWLCDGTKREKQFARLLRSWEPRAKGMFHSRAAMGWLYVLGGLDSVRRGFVELPDVGPELPKAISATTAKSWFEEAIPTEVASEIVALLRSLKDIRIRGRVSPNPIFGGTGLITGSDGDWIVDDTLVELKCISDGVKRRNVAQLICYYALSQLPDRQSRFEPFSKLALCLPRQSCTIVGHVEEWLSAFGAPPAAIAVPALHRCLDPHGLCH